MNLQNYYYYFQSALTPRTCDEIIEYGKRHKPEIAVTGGAEANENNVKKDGSFKKSALKKLHVTHRDGYSKAPKKMQMGEGRDLFGLKKNGDKLPLEISLNHMTIEDDFFVMA